MAGSNGDKVKQFIGLDLTGSGYLFTTTLGLKEQAV